MMPNEWLKANLPVAKTEERMIKWTSVTQSDLNPLNFKADVTLETFKYLDAPLISLESPVFSDGGLPICQYGDMILVKDE